MKNSENRYRRKCIYIMIYFFIVTPFLASCGGGGSGDGDLGGGNTDTLSDFQTKLNKQDEANIRYYETASDCYSQLLLIMEKVDEIIASSGNDNPVEIDKESIISDIDSTIELLDDLSADLDEMIEPEMDLLSETESFSKHAQGLLERVVLPNEDYNIAFADPVTITIVCLGALSIYSFHKTSTENLKKAIEGIKTCFNTYNVETERKQLDDCLLDVRNDRALADFWAIIPAMISAFLPAESAANVVLTGVSTASDIDNVFISGSNANSDTNETQSYSWNANYNTISIGPAESDEPKIFVAKTDETGTFKAPVGTWNIICIKDGYVRFGTREGQPITFTHETTTQIETDLFPLKEASLEDLKGDCQVPEYVVWYMDNVRCWDAPRVYATHRDAFLLEEDTCDIPGGGINCDIKVEKVEMQGGFSTLEAAQNWFCPQITTEWYHYWCNNRGPRVEIGGGALYTLQIPCDLTDVPYMYP